LGWGRKQSLFKVLQFHIAEINLGPFRLQKDFTLGGFRVRALVSVNDNSVEFGRFHRFFAKSGKTMADGLPTGVNRTNL
jgi:hypothetical protein